ncbi:MAG TPA: class I SAM-dependent methyltransferase [Pirellulaceae bacterium]|jgi:ubiquinone/menaquinone biosynthesis C-methylase UbiE|nr:class I SAM-dependent methyltransferase [Pirellulaceae bacterium]
MFHPRGPTFWELAEQCLSSTERGYDLLAPKFDYTPFRTPDEILHGVAKILGPPQSIDDALDVCCGTGAVIGILRPLCRRRVVGIDFSRGMLEVARQRFSDEPGEARVELVQQDVLEMDFSEEFDLAVTLGSNGHILPKDEPRFIERIAAALRPSGRFVFVTGEMPPWWSRHYLLSRGFNAAMHMRNLLVRPPFVMFYLTFLLPQARRLLEEHGFDVEVHSPFSGRFQVIKVVVGTKRA